MPRYELECTYCGVKRLETFWNKEFLKNESCRNGACNDRNMRIRELPENSENDVFGYKYKPKQGKKYRY